MAESSFMIQLRAAEEAMLELIDKEVLRLEADGFKVERHSDSIIATKK